MASNCARCGKEVGFFLGIKEYGPPHLDLDKTYCRDCYKSILRERADAEFEASKKAWKSGADIAPGTTANSTAYIRKASAFAGVGCLVQGFGILAFVVSAIIPLWLFGGWMVGALVVIAIALFLWGSALSNKLVCSACGTKLLDKTVTICPGCRSSLEGMK